MELMISKEKYLVKCAGFPTRGLIEVGLAKMGGGCNVDARGQTGPVDSTCHGLRNTIQAR
jgi:hypothetical protein